MVNSFRIHYLMSVWDLVGKCRRGSYAQIPSFAARNVKVPIMQMKTAEIVHQLQQVMINENL